MLRWLCRWRRAAGPERYVPEQLSKAQQAITVATGQTPTLWRPVGGLTNEAVNAQAAKAGPAGILRDVIRSDVYGGRANGPPADMPRDIPAEAIPGLSATSSPAPMPNFPISDIPGANSGGPTNGV